MQADGAADLRRRYEGKRCTHQKLDKEYYLGAQSGDYVCTTCGKEFTPREAEALGSQRRRKKR